MTASWLPWPPRADRVFVKPRYGSAAAGVVRVRHVAEAAADEGGHLGRASARRRRRAAAVQLAARVGIHGSRANPDPDRRRGPRRRARRAWIPKTAQDKSAVRSASGRHRRYATHVVVRVAGSPMTNLHLGGSPGSLEAMRGFLGEIRRRDALRTAEDAAAGSRRPTAWAWTS